MIYPYEIREERVGNLELKLVGVRHTFNDFELQKEFFSDEINKVDLVFFEDGMGNEFYRALRNQMLREGKEKYYIPDKNGNYALGSEITAGLGGLALLGKALKNNLFNKKELSRAEFLKKSLYFTAGAYLLSNSGGFVEDLTQGLVGPDSSIDNSLSYNTIQDFRNIISASNLIRGEKEGLSGKGVYFIGNRHVNGISAYLRNPGLLKKRILYFPQDLLVNTPIREYQIIDGVWKLQREI